MTYSSFRSKLDPLYKYLSLLKVDDIYKPEIGKIMHEMHAGNPPDNFKQLFTPLNQIHYYATPIKNPPKRFKNFLEFFSQSLGHDWHFL